MRNSRQSVRQSVCITCPQGSHLDCQNLTTHLNRVPFALAEAIGRGEVIGMGQTQHGRQNGQRFVFALVLISVDGTRDTPEVLRRYMRIFDPNFIDLTGPESQVRLIALEYDARFRSNRTGDSTTYTADHTQSQLSSLMEKARQFAYRINASTETVVREVCTVIRRA
ncbi:MAG: hypothetical protein KatS3mg052_1419 [Candidatus Roseilinea sp.]|nr:MAG: hypothetical protein KatS3mg052_1419 [Candidatus Roseilinea sp.]